MTDSRYGTVVNGRYLLPGPDGKPLSLQRVTNFIKAISDTYNLDLWQKRMVVKGIGLRPDLYLKAASTPLEDKDTLNRIANDAKEYAGSAAGANKGTALHSFTEQVDMGNDVVVPAPWDRDIAAYEKCLKMNGITPVPEYMERIVVCREFGVAGRFDRLYRLSDGRLVVGDVKTGKSMDFGQLDIAIQLALYANADAMWNESTGDYEPLPAELDKKEALVIHVPVETGTAFAKSVDIAQGYEAAQVCADVLRLRGARKSMMRSYARSEEEIVSEIRSATSRDELVRLWETQSALRTWSASMGAAARTRQAELAEKAGT